MRKDERYVNGASCTWHGSIHEIGQTGRMEIVINGRRVLGESLPACPHCRGVLMEHENRAEWEACARKFKEAHPELPHYELWLQSLHDSGTCRPLKDWDWRADYEEFAKGVKPQ